MGSSYKRLQEQVRRGQLRNNRSAVVPLLPYIRLNPDSNVEVIESALSFNSHVRAVQTRFRSVCLSFNLTTGLEELPQPDEFDVSGETSLLLQLLAHTQRTGGQLRLSNEELSLVSPIVWHLLLLNHRREVAFCAVQDVLRSAKCNNETSGRSLYTLSEQRISTETLRRLLALAMPRTHAVLIEMDALSNESLAFIFVAIFYPLLRTEHADRVLDCFLLEGEKILFRFALAFFSLYKKRIKDRLWPTGEIFWLYVQSDEARNTIDFEALYRRAFPPRLFGLLRLKRHLNSRTLEQIKNEVRAEGSRKEHESGDFFAGVGLALALATWWRADMFPSESRILGQRELSFRLQDFLRERRMAGGTPSYKLAFATWRDGWAIETLFKNAADLSPCILLLRTLRTGTTIGVYTSCALGAERGIQQDLTCFCFRLDGSDGPMHCGAADNVLSGSLPVELVVCSSFQLAFGGDKAFRFPVHALRLGRELNMASSFPSAAFGLSVSLVGPEETSPFAVESVELFVGSIAVTADREERGKDVRPLTILSLSGAAVQEYNEGEGEGMGEGLEGVDLDSGDGDVNDPPPPPATNPAVLSAEDKVCNNQIYLSELSDAPNSATLDGIESWNQMNPNICDARPGEPRATLLLTLSSDSEDSGTNGGTTLQLALGSSQVRHANPLTPLTRRGSPRP